MSGIMTGISLRTRLLGAAIASAVIILAVGAIGLTGLRQVARADSDLFQFSTAPISHLLALDESFQRDRINVRDYVLSRDPAERENYRKKIQAFRARMDQEAAAYRASIRTSDNQQLFSAWESADKEYATSEQQAMAASDTGRTEEALDILMGSRRTLAQAASDSIQKLTDLNLNGAKSAVAANATLAAALTRSSVIVGAGGIFLALLLSILIAFSITGRLGQSVKLAEQIAAGDLSREIKVGGRDEVARLADALNGMLKRLRRMVFSIQENSIQVASASEQIMASAHRLAEGTQTQASTLEETSASVEELTASVEQVAEHAQSQASAVEQGSSSMEQVHRSIEQVSRNLTEISGLAVKSVENAHNGAQAVSQVVEGITRIAESSDKIGGIITVIAEIADQTNLLSLNAAIEAARAGEHGRGFAVVADEVSKLADRSASSTKEIGALIKESVANVTRGVETAKGSQSAMEQIREASATVQGVISGLAESMQQQLSAVKELKAALHNVSEMSQSISAATEEQTTNARQVSGAVENINEVTQNAASAAEEMSASTSQLATMAQQLQELTSQFRIEGDVDDGERGANVTARGPLLNEPSVALLPEAGGIRNAETAPIDKAIGAHGSWKVKLASAAEGNHQGLTVEKTRSDAACEFGRWYYSLPIPTRESEEGRKVRELHADFHEAAAEVLELALGGKREEAHAALAKDSRFALLSANLTMAMMEWKRTLQ